MSELVIDSVVHSYEHQQTLNAISLTLEAGKIGCLMGPSGSGKTTVLLCVAGLERIDKGQIRLGQRLLSDVNWSLLPEKRRVGMVFQDFALFPHLSVRHNIAFGLRQKSTKEIASTIDEMLELCDLQNLQDSYPHELSGGEQQRTALARALVTKPDLLLLDEPFSRLDPTLHEKLSRQVRDIIKSRGQTTLMVTHNQNEAFLIADFGGVINGGALCQWGKVDHLYHRPNCTFVAGFVGDGALINGIMQADGSVQGVLGRLSGESITVNPLVASGEAVKVLLRPDNIIVDGENGIPSVVKERTFRGSTTVYDLDLPNGESVTSVWSSHINYVPGDTVFVSAKVKHLILFPTVL